MAEKPSPPSETGIMTVSSWDGNAEEAASSASGELRQPLNESMARMAFIKVWNFMVRLISKIVKIFLPLHVTMFEIPTAVKKSCSALFMAALLLGAILSCSRRVETGFDSLELVDILVRDSLPVLQHKAARAGSADGKIILLGDVETFPRLCALMKEEDAFDNVDAKAVPDGLPDFAGETIVPLVDFTQSPFSEMLSGNDGPRALKELAVRLSLAALDSSLNCKVLVICSPLMAEYGGDDISDFYEKIGCNVPVIYSADTTVSLSKECFMTMREKNLFTHNISFPEVRYYEILPTGDGLDMKLEELPTVTTMVEEALATPDAAVSDTTLAE